MKVRPGIIFSSTAHAALLAYAIVGLSSAKPFETGPTEALPIEILTPQEFDAMTKGSKTSKKVDAPAQKAEKVAEAESEPAADDLKVAKEDVKAPPPPAAEPPKADAPPVPDPAKIAAEKAAEAQKAADAQKAAEVEKALKAEKAAQEKAAAAEKAEKAAAAKAAAEKVAAEKAAAQAAEAELRAKAEAEKEAKAKVEAEKLAKAEAEKQAKAEAEKAAKEKAEKLAKLEAEKAAKAKAEAEKLAKAEKEAKEKAAAEKAAKAAERKFDPNKIASLLGDKPSASDSALKDVREASRKASAARAEAPETTAGTSRGTATKLSMSARTGIDNAVREQVMQCWNPPIGAANDGSLAVKVSFTLNSDGTLSDGPTVVNSSSNPAFRAAAGAATRAVQRCAPLKLPADAYDYWRQVTINFDPKDMMGG